MCILYNDERGINNGNNNSNDNDNSKYQKEPSVTKAIKVRISYYNGNWTSALLIKLS